MERNFLSEGDKIQGTDKTILDYWKWGHSAILDNTEAWNLCRVSSWKCTRCIK